MKTIEDTLKILATDYNRPVTNLVDGVWTYYNGVKTVRNEIEFLYLGELQTVNSTTSRPTPNLDYTRTDDIVFLNSLDQQQTVEEIEQQKNYYTSLAIDGYRLYYVAYRVGIDKYENKLRYFMFASKSYYTTGLYKDDEHRNKAELVRRTLALIEKIYNE